MRIPQRGEIWDQNRQLPTLIFHAILIVRWKRAIIGKESQVNQRLAMLAVAILSNAAAGHPALDRAGYGGGVAI
jgi:hypothetical protein